ncbi:MAG TPA: PAS domain S-box protein, partial [Candidatus Methylomirabilis sp.]
MRPKSKAELTAEIKTLQTRIHNLETGGAAQRDTTAAPHLREQEFRALVEHCPDVVARFDSALRHSYVSPAVQVVTGLSPQAFIGKTNLELGMPQDLAERWETALRQVFETGQEVCIEFEYPSPNGPRHYESRLSPARAEDGAIAAVFSIARDVTDRKRVEEALREGAARFRSLCEHSMDAILLTVPDGRILAANPEACRILGRSEEEICRIGRAGVVDPTDPRLPVLLEERARTGKCKRELTLVRKDGTKFPGEMSSAVFADRDGLPRTSMTIRDVTERKRAEEARRASQHLLEATFAALRDAVFIMGADTVGIVDCNPAASEIFGYSREELLGRTTAVLHVDQAALEEFRRHLFLAIEAEGFLGHLEFRMKRKDGTVFPTEHSVVPLEDREGRRVGWVSVVRDITDRKRAEESLRESEERFREVSSAITDIAYSCTRGPDRNYAIDWLTGAVGPIAGYATEEIQALGCWGRLVLEEDRALFEANVTGLAPGASGACELRLRTKDGGVAWVASYSRCVAPPQDPGNPRLFGALVDIADSKLAEEGLREQTRLSRIFLDALPCVALLLNRDRVVVAANQAGMNAGAYPGSRCFSTWGQREDPCPWCLAPTALQAGEPQHVEVETLGVVWDAHWIPAGSDLYLHYAFDIIERKRATETLLMRARQIEAVRAIGEEITRELDLPTLLELIDRRAAELVGATSGTVLLWDEQAELLIPMAWHGLGEWVKDHCLRLGEGSPGIAAQRREGMIINDYRNSPYALPATLEHTKINTILAEPLIYRDRLLGVLTVDKHGPGSYFTNGDRELFRLFASQAAIAIENAR